MNMAFTYDPSTSAGRVRLLIADTSSSGRIFEDSEITAFLAMNGDSVNSAAAQALESIAANRSLLARRIKVLDIEVDFKSAAVELRALAKQLRESEEEGGDFYIAEMVFDPASERERIWKQSQRGVL